MQTRAPSSITATAQVAAVGSSSGSSPVGQVALGPGDRGGRELHAADRAGEAPGGRWCRARRGAGRTRTTRSPPRCSRRRPAAPAGRRTSAGTSPPWSVHDRGRRGVQPQRPARVAEPAPGAHRLAGLGRGQRGRASATRASQASWTGSTRATGVCWSMNSETITAHGARLRASPGQVARVLVVPLEDGAVEVAHRAPDANRASYTDRQRCRSPIPRRSAGYRERMSAVTRPRGPLPARVYWTRRLLVLGARVPAGLRDRPGARRRQRRSSSDGDTARQVAGEPSTTPVEQRRGAEQHGRPPTADEGQEGQADHAAAGPARRPVRPGGRRPSSR